MYTVKKQEESKKGDGISIDFSAVVGTPRTWDLPKEGELRLECEENTSITVTLKRGSAEVYGTELAPGRSYTFKQCKIGIFTWEGCSLAVKGEADVIYEADETPMVSYINAHAALDALRKKAKATGTRGPRCLVVGPTNSGKSSLCRILANYAVRAGWKPTYMDLDCGQNAVAVPGCVAASPVETPMDVECPNALPLPAPVAFFYGHDTPATSPTFYKRQVENLVAAVDERCQTVEEAEAAGVIVNTGGWVTGDGYDVMMHAAKTCQADVVLVLGQDRLFAKMKGDARLAGCRVVKLGTSGGVVTQGSSARRKARDAAVRAYFYGPKGLLSPHKVTVSFRDIYIYRVGGGPLAPSSVLPLGAKRRIDPNKPVLMEASRARELLHSLCSVPHCREEGGMLESNSAGFIVITAIDAKKKLLTYLSPSPGDPVSDMCLSGSIKWFEGLIN